MLSMVQRQFKIDIKRYGTYLGIGKKTDNHTGSKIWEYEDLYSNLLFKGSNRELSEFLKECSKDHRYFKVLGVHDIIPEGYEICKFCNGNGHEEEAKSCCGDSLDDYMICKTCGEHCDGAEPEECQMCDDGLVTKNQ